MRRGTSSACARRMHSTRRCPKSAGTLRGHVLHSVQRPVHVFASQDARQSGIAVGKTCASRRNRHRGLIERTTARLAARHRSRSREVVRDASEKEGGHGPRPCEETRAPCSVLVRRKQLQKSAGSILASNKHARSAPKRVTVRVNGGLGGAVTGTRVSAATSIEEMIW
jgi:hypothetical protein